MMEEVEVVTLEDDKNYIIVDTIDEYVYLVDEEDDTIKRRGVLYMSSAQNYLQK